MRLLILGGTVFLGRYLADEALRAGHAVTLFNRGKNNPDLFPEAERLVGDRLAGEDGLAALRGRTWDAVIDTCGYVPRVARASAQLLRDAVGHYTFVSSISVYADLGKPGVAEDAPVGTLADPAVEEIRGDTYGPLKALCESAVMEILPGRALSLRPGLLVGPNDPSGRFTYWPRRIGAGGEVLAPGDATMPVEFIDARDAAAWMLRCAESRVTGVLNMTGPAGPLTMGVFLDACRAALNPRAALRWVPEPFLLAQGATPWTEIPLWVPAADGGGVMSIDITAALGRGLCFRPMEETIRDTFDWDAAGGPAALAGRGKAGLDPDKERAWLAAWRAERPA
jgi:2'-hydroxyisoflavone reductase